MCVPIEGWSLATEKATEDHKMLLGHCMYVAQMVAKQENLEKGFRVVINDGVDGCQSVYHLHLHVRRAATKLASGC